MPFLTWLLKTKKKAKWRWSDLRSPLEPRKKKKNTSDIPLNPAWVILLMAEILHQLIGSLSHYLQGFIHPRWCRISSIDSRDTLLETNIHRTCQEAGTQKERIIFQPPIFQVRLLLVSGRVKGCSNPYKRWKILVGGGGILVGGFNPFEQYARQIGSFLQVGVKIKDIWNHHLEFHHPDKRFTVFRRQFLPSAWNPRHPNRDPYGCFQK